MLKILFELAKRGKGISATFKEARYDPQAGAHEEGGGPQLSGGVSAFAAKSRVEEMKRCPASMKDGWRIPGNWWENNDGYGRAVPPPETKSPGEKLFGKKLPVGGLAGIDGAGSMAIDGTERGDDTVGGGSQYPHIPRKGVLTFLLVSARKTPLEEAQFIENRYLAWGKYDDMFCDEKLDPKPPEYRMQRVEVAQARSRREQEEEKEREEAAAAEARAAEAKVAVVWRRRRRRRSSHVFSPHTQLWSPIFHTLCPDIASRTHLGRISYVSFVTACKCVER